MKALARTTGFRFYGNFLIFTPLGHPSKSWPFLIRNEDGENRRWGDRETKKMIGR
jgi:hypothetical protein